MENGRVEFMKYDKLTGRTGIEICLKLQLRPLNRNCAALTELRGDDGNVVPGLLFSVQLPQDVHRPVSCVDVEHSVHVRLPIDGVPAQNVRVN